MKNKKFINAIGTIGDDLVIKAHSACSKRVKRHKALYALAIAAFICLIAIVIIYTLLM